MKLFWLLLSVGCVGWYFVVLGIVVVKGGVEIKQMLKKFSAIEETDASKDQIQ